MNFGGARLRGGGGLAADVADGGDRRDRLGGWWLVAGNAPKKLCFGGQVAAGDREATRKRPRWWLVINGRGGIQ